MQQYTVHHQQPMHLQWPHGGSRHQQPAHPQQPQLPRVPHPSSNPSSSSSRGNHGDGHLPQPGLQLQQPAPAAGSRRERLVAGLRHAEVLVSDVQRAAADADQELSRELQALTALEQVAAVSEQAYERQLLKADLLKQEWCCLAHDGSRTPAFGLAHWMRAAEAAGRDLTLHHAQHADFTTTVQRLLQTSYQGAFELAARRRAQHDAVAAKRADVDAAEARCRQQASELRTRLALLHASWHACQGYHLQTEALGPDGLPREPLVPEQIKAQLDSGYLHPDTPLVPQVRRQLHPHAASRSNASTAAADADSRQQLMLLPDPTANQVVSEWQASVAYAKLLAALQKQGQQPEAAETLARLRPFGEDTRCWTFRTLDGWVQAMPLSEVRRQLERGKYQRHHSMHHVDNLDVPLLVMDVVMVADAQALQRQQQQRRSGGAAAGGRAVNGDAEGLSAAAGDGGGNGAYVVDLRCVRGDALGMHAKPSAW